MANFLNPVKSWRFDAEVDPSTISIPDNTRRVFIVPFFISLGSLTPFRVFLFPQSRLLIRSSCPIVLGSSWTSVSLISSVSKYLSLQIFGGRCFISVLRRFKYLSRIILHISETLTSLKPLQPWRSNTCTIPLLKDLKRSLSRLPNMVSDLTWDKFMVSTSFARLESLL